MELCVPSVELCATFFITQRNTEVHKEYIKTSLCNLSCFSFTKIEF
jgi:hypothetical protein